MSCRPASAPMKNERGATLIEVLVAMVIMSFGILGASGASVIMTQQAQSAAYRAYAQIKAMDMAEVIRLEADAGIPGGDYLAQWNEEVAALVSGGIGRIEVVDAGTGAIVTINWADRPDRGSVEAAPGEDEIDEEDEPAPRFVTYRVNL